MYTTSRCLWVCPSSEMSRSPPSRLRQSTKKDRHTSTTPDDGNQDILNILEMVSSSKQIMVQLLLLLGFVVGQCWSFVLSTTESTSEYHVGYLEGHHPVGRPSPRLSLSRGDNDDRITASESSGTLSSSIPALPKLIVTCATTEELKEAVESYIQPHHVVAEIGSQLRDVSTAICERCQRATLVDVQRKFPNARIDQRRTEAMRLPQDDNSFFPDKASFHEMAQLSDWVSTIFSEPSSGRPYYDVLVLDVNAIVGNDLEWTSLQMIQQFHASNQNAELLILVKSSGLNQWANRIHHPSYWRDHQVDLWNIMKSPPFIVATVGVQEYRSTINDTVRPTDFVLEVGCHYGTTTALLRDKAAHCMGVDVGSKIIAQAKIRFPGIDFRVGDAWKTGELLRFFQDYKSNHNVDAESLKGFDVVYVDVGGLSGSDGMLEAIQLISSIRYAIEPRCIVIKSKCMQRLSTKLMSYWMLKKKQRNHQDATS